MRFKGLDLNLIWAFQVIMEERSVTAAARRIHLSQPAMSGALNRLREYFDDDLIITVGRNMVPTARGEQLYDQSLSLLREIDNFISGSSDFDVEKLNKCFCIAASDYVSEVLLVPLVRHLAEVAANIKIEIISPGLEAEKAFLKGDIDILILPAPFTLEGHPSTPIYSDKMMVVGWQENPAMHEPMEAEVFLKHQHVIVGSNSHQGFPEQQLKALKRSLNKSIVVPTFHLVGGLVVGTQRLALLHGRLAKLQAQSLPLAIVENPFGFAPFEECLQIHSTRAYDPALKWLRKTILHVAREEMLS